LTVVDTVSIACAPGKSKVYRRRRCIVVRSIDILKFNIFDAYFVAIGGFQFVVYIFPALDVNMNYSRLNFEWQLSIVSARKASIDDIKRFF